MSPALAISPKHCAEKGKLKIKNSYKKLFFTLSAFFSSVFLFILVIYFILHPAKPKFSLEEADIYQLNFSGVHLLNFTIQLTLSSKNPNRKVGIYYNELQVYAAYKSQQITSGARLPPFYQGHEESNLLTASLIGNGLPLAPSFAYEVGRDWLAGKVVLNLKVNGRLKWKIGSWVSRSYPLDINCAAVIPANPAGRLSSGHGTQCSTKV